MMDIKIKNMGLIFEEIEQIFLRVVCVWPKYLLQPSPSRRANHRRDLTGRVAKCDRSSFVASQHASCVHYLLLYLERCSLLYQTLGWGRVGHDTNMGLYRVVFVVL